MGVIAVAKKGMNAAERQEGRAQVFGLSAELRA